MLVIRDTFIWQGSGYRVRQQEIGSLIGNALKHGVFPHTTKWAAVIKRCSQHKDAWHKMDKLRLPISILNLTLDRCSKPLLTDSIPSWLFWQLPRQA